MIFYRQWIERGGRVHWMRDGWFLFGFIPLFVAVFLPSRSLGGERGEEGRGGHAANAAGKSLCSRPSSAQPFSFGLAPPHCLWWKATPFREH
jgi:hypothetical protein